LTNTLTNNEQKSEKLSLMVVEKEKEVKNLTETMEELRQNLTMTS
jgi:hypothetical protein